MTGATHFSVSASGDDEGPDDSPPTPWASAEAPDNELPATLALDQPLAETDDVVVYISGMDVYSRGVGFTVEIRARPGWKTEAVSDIWEAFHGRSTDHLLLGVEFADGRRCANIEGPMGADSGMSLLSHGSSGGGRSASASWYLSPLPPPGDVRIYCAWPAAGIADTVATIDASRILKASGRARELWPWEPERERAYQPVRPTVPAGSWFARMAASDE